MSLTHDVCMQFMAFDDMALVAVKYVMICCGDE